MEKFRKVCLPCDLSQWPEIKKLLGIAKSASTFEAWIHRLQKVYNAVQSSCSSDTEKDRGAKAKSPNVFQGLSIYLNDYLTAESGQRYLNDLLPFVVERALKIETFGTECDFVVPDGDTTIVLTRACACSLLACFVLCIVPDQGGNRSFTFEGLYGRIASGYNSDVQLQKLHCIFQYYELVSKNLVDPSEEVVFVRQVLTNIPTPEAWLTSRLPMCRLDIVTSDAGRVRHGKRGHLIIFGEESFGSQVLGDGSEEMESCFVENPELLAAMIFFDRRMENEVVMVRGATRFTTFPPGPDLLGARATPTLRPDPTSRPTICCSSLPRRPEPRDRVKGLTHRHRAVVRVAGRVLSAFQQPSMDKSRFEEEEKEEEGEEEGRKRKEDAEGEDLPGSSSSTSSNHPLCRHHQQQHPPPLQRHQSSRTGSNEGSEGFPASRPTSSISSRRVQPWRSQSSTSSGGSLDWSRQTTSFELEGGSSESPSGVAGMAAGEEGMAALRRRSSGLHSTTSSSRRSSGLSSQLSEEGGGGMQGSRRRSSAMSEASQRSGFSSSSSSSGTGGKRSSTDYSSEMEEYFDSFQKRSSIKTSVIEEEPGPTEDPGVGASRRAGSLVDRNPRRPVEPRTLRRFARDRPTDALRPTPVKHSSLDVPMMALDNFTDNLINRVAQDSREEIARMADPRRFGVELCMERALSMSPKFFRRGRSADLFNLKARESLAGPSVETYGIAERYADAVSRHLLMEVFSDVSRMTGHSASVPYETGKSLEDFAADFVSDVFGEAFRAFGRREIWEGRPDRLRERVEAEGKRKRKKSARSARNFFVDERQLFVYSRRENDKMHVCSGSICFEEEEEEEEEEDLDGYDSGEIGARMDRGSNLDVSTPRAKRIGRSPSSGFRDPVLSDFEDLLINSSFDQPSHISFASGRGSAFAPLPSPGGVGGPVAPRSPRESEIEASRLRWFGRERPSDDPRDGYAERFVAEVFWRAVRQMESDRARSAVSRLEEPVAGATVNDYAGNLVQCIMEEALIELEKRSHICIPEAAVDAAEGGPVGGQGGRSARGAVAPPAGTASSGSPCRPEQWPPVRDGRDDPQNDPVLVGHYGVGVYADDPELQAVVYWLCASYMGLPGLIYFPHGNSKTNKLPALVEAVRRYDWSVGRLFSELLLWCSGLADGSSGEGLVQPAVGGAEGLTEFLLLRRLT